MKKRYPDYTKESLTDVYNRQTENNKKIIDKFLEYCQITAGDSSVIKIHGKIIQIVDIIEKDLNKLNLEDVRGFLVILNKSNRATETQNDTKKILKRFLRWKYKDWNSKFDELKDIKQKRKGSSEKLSKEELLTEEEIEKLMRASKELRYKALIILLYETAGRPEEILKLKWKDINFEDKKVKLGSTKTGDMREVFINQSVNRLDLYKQEYSFGDAKAEDYVFPTPRNRKTHLTNQTINYYLKVLGKEVLNKRVFPYLFRHTRLNSLRKKLSPDVYEKFSGHSMEVALSTYSHIDNDDVKEEMFDRIYNIKELSKSEKTEFKILKKDFDVHKKETTKRIEFLEGAWNTYIGSKKHIAKQDEKGNLTQKNYP